MPGAPLVYVSCPGCSRRLPQPIYRGAGIVADEHGKGGQRCRIVICPDPDGERHQVVLLPDDLSFETVMAARLRMVA